MAFQPNEKEVSEFVQARRIGEWIQFTRNGVEVPGTIFKILENSVIVEISPEDAKEIGAASNLTVISHKKYKIME
ncbi:DUF2187 family protein [Planococcus lenghuensis]|uniref:DUF2187 domain-containing protein n=1 Tax=Planococcus lenghuensis TaxID=2213202 RepID=A0A1Q2L2G8_9BACL|nr:DUF2187 family protein [Planococcus lenghuensis]AQQ54257.1 hypothetical protein B0X71_14895 [Planococcus lenghuensis]